MNIEHILLEPFEYRFFLRFTIASRKITLIAGNGSVGIGGKKLIGVRPSGTNPAAIDWTLDVTAIPEKSDPPPTIR